MDQPAIPFSEGREFSKPLIHLKVRVVMPGRVFGTAGRKRGPARTNSGLPLGSPVRQLGNPGAGQRSDDQMQAVGGRAGDGTDLLAESIFIDSGRIMNRHEQPTRIAAHIAQVG